MKASTDRAAAKNEWLVVGLRLLLGAIFVYAGFQKASAPAVEFAAVVEAYYPPVPQSWILPFAQILPWLELVFGAYLIAGYRTRLSAAAIAGMLLMFVGALGQALWRGIPLENCGCFGSSFHVNPHWGIFFDSALILCGLWIVRSPVSRWSADHWVACAEP